ncbi:MAG: transglutaminase family protein [Eubacterium sp.]|nr:transglutaminase family protein [Eubacterium sp.]
MSKLHFDYWTDISYSEVVNECHYTLKCLPQDTDMQQIKELNIAMTPQHEYHRSVDSYGNQTLYGDIYEAHNRFGFHITGVAHTECAISEQTKEDEFVGIYRYPNTLNKAGSRIKAYFDSLQVPACGTLEEGVTDYDRAVYMMNALHRDFVYESGVTHVGTTAEEAWQLGKGVCQDYAHILIGMCHLAGIPARYVTGMMVGEGYSHAWVEILSKGYWYGLDPTNGGVTTGNYIKIAVGRHANDCVVNKGIVKGGGWQTQEIRVAVEEME